MKPIKYLLLSVVLLASACRKDAPELTNPNDGKLLNTPSQVFETFWHAMNDSYVFWDIDPTDWDKVYEDYLPRFRELDALETVETATLQKLFTEICSNLIDHHFFLEIVNPKPPREEEDITIWAQPGGDEVANRDYSHSIISKEDLLKCLDGYKTAGRISDLVTGQNGEMFASSCNIDNGIIYLYLSSFSILGVNPDIPEDTVMEAIDNYRRLVLETPEVKGVIIDVRGNGGGYLADMEFTLAPLIGEEVLIGYTRAKEGLGRLDYGPWVPSILVPAEQHREINSPIVALADINSVSMAEMTCMAVSAFPNGCVVGERTFGGTGPLVGDYSFYYSGQVDNARGMRIYTSSAMMKDAQGVIHEGVGVTPDIEIRFDQEAMSAGTDRQLDRAIEYVHTGK